MLSAWGRAGEHGERPRNESGGRGATSELHLLGHFLAVLVAKVAVHLHRQRPAVFVAKPAADSWDVHPRFDAAGGKEVAQIVVSDPWDAQLPASAREGLIAVRDFEDWAGLLLSAGLKNQKEAMFMRGGGA